MDEQQNEYSEERNEDNEDRNEDSEDRNEDSEDRNEDSDERNEDSAVNPREQRLTRSLRSGSDTSFSRSGCSTPHLLCSAPDVASVIMDFSRKNVEEGVVDSLPIQGPARTSICSMPPLKQAPSTPTRPYLHSPTLCTEITPHKKLYIVVKRHGEEHHAIDGVSLPIAPPLYVSDFKTDSTCKDCKRKVQLSSSSVSQNPHVSENGSLPSKSIRGESSRRT